MNSDDSLNDLVKLLEGLEESSLSDPEHPLEPVHQPNTPPWNYTGKQLFPPFTYFGGKRKIAHEVWLRFGEDIPNYIEPFAGGLSVLLARPIIDLDILATKRYRELVADSNCFLLNFWRAVQSKDLNTIVEQQHFPAHEVQLLNLRERMMERHDELVETLKSGVENYDAVLAAYWLYIQREWIGAGADDPSAFPRRKMIRAVGGSNLGGSLKEHLEFCQARTRYVRFFDGGWKRPIESVTQTEKIGVTGVFLDPPYMGSTDIYTGTLDEAAISDRTPLDAREWALEKGTDENFRIAYCGYLDQHQDFFPTTGENKWTVRSWALRNGYSTADPNAPPKIDTIWFSPHCLPVDDSLIKYRYPVTSP